MSQMGSYGSGSVVPPILTLTGNSGGAVSPDGAGNINTLGSGVVTVAGNPGTNTLTISVGGSVATSFATDSGTATPALGVLTIHGTGGISTSGAGSTVTIDGSALSFPWTVITADQTAVINNGYICNKSGTLSIALPAVATIGSVIRVTGINTALGWQVTQGAGQQIFFGTSSTTLGAGGSLASSATRDAIEMVCVTANTTWQIVSSVGNITVV